MAYSEPNSPNPTTDDPAAAAVGAEIESRFDTHDVDAYCFEASYSDREHTCNSAKWGVVCQDCGRAEDFHIAMDSETGEYRVSPVYVESLEERPCEPYTLPDIDTGDHTITVANEDPETTGRRREAWCVDCGRTTKVSSDPEYAYMGIDKFGSRPCGPTYNDVELVAAVTLSSLPQSPNPAEVGIGNWTCERGDGWGRRIKWYWTHPTVPMAVVGRSLRGDEWVIELREVDPNLPNPQSLRNETWSAVRYENNEDGQPCEEYREAIIGVLVVMQAFNDTEIDATVESEMMVRRINNAFDGGTVDRTVGTE